MDEYRIEIKVKNNLLYSMIKDAGYSSPSKFAELNNISSVQVYDLISMKRSPIDRMGLFYPIVNQIAEALDCMPEHMFTESQLRTKLKTNSFVKTVNEANAMYYLDQKNNLKSLEDLRFHDEFVTAITESIETLTPREQKVINMRFGLGEYDKEHTLEDVGKHFRVRRERIRQIEAKALRKLRHPSRSEHIREFITESF